MSDATGGRGRDHETTHILQPTAARSPCQLRGTWDRLRPLHRKIFRCMNKQFFSNEPSVKRTPDLTLLENQIQTQKTRWPRKRGAFRMYGLWVCLLANKTKGTIAPEYWLLESRTRRRPVLKVWLQWRKSGLGCRRFESRCRQIFPCKISVKYITYSFHCCIHKVVMHVRDALYDCRWEMWQKILKIHQGGGKLKN